MDMERPQDQDATSSSVDADDLERMSPPLLGEAAEASSSGSSVPLLGAQGQEMGKDSNLYSNAPNTVLCLVFLEVTAFYGVYLNLIVYLQDVLHGDSASNAATVGFWAGVSFLMPVIGAAIADTCWGKYKTVLVGLCIALAGMAVITTSATLPSLSPPPCDHGAYCAPATLGQRMVFFAGIYLCAIGIGGAKAVIVSFGAEQFDDGDGKNAAEAERKATYFSWYYGVSNLGMLTSGTLLVWVEDKVSWGLGYGVCASFVAVTVVGLAATAPLYRIVPPVGSPCQVLVAVARKASVRVPDDPAELYVEERGKTPLLDPPRELLEHTDQFRCLDRAAVVTGADVEDGDPWRLCTVTQVEELKTLLRLVPIWLTSAVYFVANSQAQTTFVQQDTMTDSRVAGGAFSVPAASLTCIETVFVVASIALYNRAVAPAATRGGVHAAEAHGARPRRGDRGCGPRRVRRGAQAGERRGRGAAHGHRVAAAAVRRHGRLRRLAQRRPARVLLRPGAGDDAGRVHGVLLPVGLDREPPQLTTGDAGGVGDLGGREDGVVPAGHGQRPPGLLLPAPCRHHGGELRRFCLPR